MTETPLKPQIVFVDDEQRLLDMYRLMLRKQADIWEMYFFADSRTAWEFVQQFAVDAVVTDVSMPHLNGLELVERMRSHPATCDVPVTMLSGLGDVGLKRQVLDLGATDLLNKPMQAQDLIARLRSMLRLKSAEDELKRRNHDLEEIIRKRTKELRQSRLQIIWRLGKAAEFRDEGTGEHVVRVGYCSRILAETMGLSEPFLDELFLAAPLHDIGKIGIPDAILLKPGRLTDEERRVMQTHCEIGERILREPSLTEICCETLTADAASLLEGDSLMELARQIALSHHEHWDGRGYPHHLCRTAIPLAARIVSVADVYDALTSTRPYKTALPHDEAVRIISNGRGAQFDPQVVEALEQSQLRLEEVRHRVGDALRRVSDVSVNRTAGDQPNLSPQEGVIADSALMSLFNDARFPNLSDDNCHHSFLPLISENRTFIHG